jgi:hypothetical protein
MNAAVPAPRFSDRTIRLALGLGVPLLAAGVALGPIIACGSSLPRRLARTGTSRPRPIMWIVTGALVVATIAVGLITGRWGVTVLATIATVVSLVMTGNRVTVGPSGLRASMGVFGRPRVNVPIDKIVQASVLNVQPMKWGGWGYRSSLKVMKRAAMVVRAGDGIRLDLVGGLVLVVTVDDAATGAAVLQTAIASRALPSA